MDGSGSTEYYIQDQLGSTRGLLDASGTVVGTSTFTPYGEIKGHSGASTPFGYAGQYTDSESGLQYLRARYYDPSSAQFLTMDPITDQTGQPYGCAGDNAVNAVDPGGTCEAQRHETTNTLVLKPWEVGGCHFFLYDDTHKSQPHYNLQVQSGNGKQLLNYHIYYQRTGHESLGPIAITQHVWKISESVHKNDPDVDVAGYTDIPDFAAATASAQMLAIMIPAVSGECGQLAAAELAVKLDSAGPNSWTTPLRTQLFMRLMSLRH